MRAAGKWLLVTAIGFGMVVWSEELRVGISYALGLRTTFALAQAAPIAYGARSTSTVEVRAGANGHFTAMAVINGRSIPALVDTGASKVVLSYEDAERVGIFVRPVDFTGQVHTANGVAKVVPIRLDSVSIGGITIHDLEAVVTEPGRLGTTLLGMTFIGRLHRAEIRGGILILQD